MYTLVNRAYRLMWWHIQSLVWGEGKVAEYVAKLGTWLVTPSQYRGREILPLEG